VFARSARTHLPATDMVRGYCEFMASLEVNAETSVDVCVRRSGEAAEIFAGVKPRAKVDAALQATALVDAVAAILRRYKAVLFQERIFAPTAAMQVLAQARARSYGSCQDAVEPTWLVVPENDYGPTCAIQIHAVAGCGPSTVLSASGQPCGRLVQQGPLRYVVGCNLQSDGPGAPADQARSMLIKAEHLLTQAGGTLADMSRTWMWLGNILDWYGDFNRVRSEVFAARGLLRSDASGNLPASTGIGVGPNGPRRCAMDFCATLGGSGPRFLLGASRQGPASKYGSAFSRAAVAQTLAGKTVYVSGTAAIDASGQTTNLGNIRGQIQDTLENVRCVLQDAGACQEDVVQAIIYCKTREVERVFRSQWEDLRMPYILVRADVCRENLLFEMEVTAMPTRV
jgi:enamine deaminase RidA (YjgF/YER057c/UK114 family)